MNREERERLVDRVLNEALAPQEIQPRAGLEQRILANLRAQPLPRPRWRWMWVPAVAALLIAGYLGLFLMAISFLAIGTLISSFTDNVVVAYVGTLFALLVLYTHRANIERMRAGTESRATRLWLFGPKGQA